MLVLVRHTHFKAKIGIPPFTCTIGIEYFFVEQSCHVECVVSMSRKAE